MEELKQKFHFWHERRTNCSLLTGVEFFRASNAASQWLIQDNWTTSESDHNQDFMTLISMELHRPVPEKFALPVVCFRSIKTHFFMNGCIAYYSCRKWNLPVLEICILRRPEGARWKRAATPLSSPRKRDLPILKKINYKSACFNRSFSLSHNKKVN